MNALIDDKLANHLLWLHGDPAGVRADLSGCVLASANLVGANLTRADLEGVDLASANLAGANLTGANLTGANLTGANLTGANLKYAILAESNLEYAILAGANLEYAILTEANLIRADLTGANLKYVILTGANLMHTVTDTPVWCSTFGSWGVTLVGDVLRIGCRSHKVAEWNQFSDATINGMHGSALVWWRRYKTPIMLMVEALNEAFNR